MTTYNFPTHVKGDTFKSKKIQISSIKDEISSFLDLTGCQITIQFKGSVNSPVVFDFKTSNSTILITNATEGEFELQSRIINVLASTYVYDVQITFPDSSVKTYFRGSMKVESDVTRTS